MPTLSRLFVRASLIYLALGALSGAAIMVEKSSALWPALWTLLPLHIEWMMIGWMVQLALGVAWWLLPRLADNTRGRPVASWAAWALLNLGLLLRASGHAVGVASGHSGEALSTLGLALEGVGVASFAFAAWPRVSHVPQVIRRWRQQNGQAP